MSLRRSARQPQPSAKQREADEAAAEQTKRVRVHPAHAQQQLSCPGSDSYAAEKIVAEALEGGTIMYKILWQVRAPAGAGGVDGGEMAVYMVRVWLCCAGVAT